MGSELFRKEDVFKKTVEEVDVLLKPLTHISIREVIERKQILKDPFVNHIAIFTCQVSSWRLWEYWGIQVDAVVGQSVGEVAAAFASGVISLSMAVRLIYYRSLALSKVYGGRMFVVGNVNVSHVEDICSHFQEKACIAVYSSSTFCTVACDENILNQVQLKLRQHGDTVYIRDLIVQCAYHSKSTHDAGIELERFLVDLNGGKGNIPMISSVTGNEVESSLLLSPNYWKENVQKPVLFNHASVSAGKKGNHNIFLEIGPKPVLNVHLKDSCNADDGSCVLSMKEHKEVETLKCSIKELFIKGLTLNWKHILGEPGFPVDIPQYTFNCTKRLFEPEQRRLKNNGMDFTNASLHLFVGKTDINGNKFKVTIDPSTTPFVYEHFVSDTVVVPGAFYAEVALEVGKNVFNARPQDVEVSIKFLHPLTLISGKPTSAEVTVRQIKADNSYHGEIRKENAILSDFKVRLKSSQTAPSFINLARIRQTCTELQSSEEIYNTLAFLGFSYGKDLQILKDVMKAEDECLVEMSPSKVIWKDIAKTHFHPGILDGLLQMLGILESIDDSDNRTLMPKSIERLTLSGVPEKSMYGYARKIRTTESFIAYNMLLLTKEGLVIAELINFQIQKVGVNGVTGLMYNLSWNTVEMREETIQHKEKEQSNADHILVFSFDLDVLLDVKKIFSGKNTTIHQLMGRSLSELKKQIQEVLKAPVSKLCYIPGMKLNQSFDGHKILEDVQQSCIAFLAISQSISKLENTCQMYVITEQTQAFNECHRYQSVHYMGAELWGQVRSTVWETSLPIKLVDVQIPLREAEFLLKKVVMDETGELMTYGEFILTKEHIWTNSLQIIQNEAVNRQYRIATFDNHCLVELRSLSSRNITNLFCMLQEEVLHLKNCITLNVDIMCQHHPDICPIVVKTKNNGDEIWPQDAKEGFQILTVEVTGKIYKKQETGTQHQESQSENQVYVACYPMVAASTVTVPESCVFKVNSLPWYQPGLITTASLLMALVEEIDTLDDIVVLYHESTEFPANLLQLMITSVKGCAVEITQDEYTCSPNNVLIPLVQIDANFIKIMKEFIDVGGYYKKIVSLRSFIKVENLRWISIKGDTVFHVVDPNEIFSKPKIGILVPKVFAWLQEHLLKVSAYKYRSNKNISEVLPVPCPSLSLNIASLSTQMELKVDDDQPFRRNGCYIVVGGLTGLGKEIVRCLADNGAGYVVILSRKSADQAQADEMNSISNDTGCIIHSFSTDISKIDDVNQAFHQIEITVRKPIKGIFQGAGILMDSLFEKMDEKHFGDVLIPKVLGTWNLHVVSQKHPLDYFVMHSSMTSVFGNQGQSNYGAANAFMDTLAYYRRSVGLCGQSINWGPLAVGMAANDPNVESYLKTLGYYALSVDDIRICLLNCLNNNRAQIICGLFDWKSVGNLLSSAENKTIISKFQSVLKVTIGSIIDVKDRALPEQDGIDFSNTTGAEREELVRQIVFKTAEEVFQTGTRVYSDETLISDLGIDSMQAMTFVNRMNEHLNYRMPVIQLLGENTTLQKITQTFASKISNIGNKSLKPEQSFDNFIMNSMTIMEKRCFDAFKEDPSNPALYMFADIEVSMNMANPQIWKDLLRKVHRKHPSLRTLFVPAGNNIRYGIQKKVLSIDDFEVDFKIVEMDELMHIERLPTDTAKYVFDPSKDLPLRTLFSVKEGQCIIRFVFSHICFDLSSIWTVMKDLKTAIGYSDQKHLESNRVIDIAMTFETHLQHEFNKLTIFWRSKIPRKLRSMSLGVITSNKLHANEFRHVSVELSAEIICDIRSVLKSEGLKLFDFMASIYQLLLFTNLTVPFVSIATIVDLRLHFPEFVNQVCRFTNQIPLTASFENRSMTMKQFLQRNKTSLSMSLDKCIFPMTEISKFVQGCDPFELRRHLLIMEETSNVGLLNVNDRYNVSVKRFTTTNSDNETMFLIWHDKNINNLKLELGYSTVVFSQDKAYNLLNQAINLIKILSKDRNIRIGNLVSPNSRPCTVQQSDVATKPQQNTSSSSKNHTKPEKKIYMGCHADIETNRVSVLTSTRNEGIDEENQNHRSRDEIILTDEINDVNKQYFRGTFMKQTSRGWDHQIYLVIKECEQHDSEPALMWGSNKSKLSRSLPCSRIITVDKAEINSKYWIIIKTTARKYTFKTGLKNLADTLMTHLGQRIGL